MNLLQALESLNVLPDGVTIVISVSNADYGVTLFCDDDRGTDDVGYGMDEVGSDIDGLIERIVAARDTALEFCVGEVSQERKEESAKIIERMRQEAELMHEKEERENYERLRLKYGDDR